MPEPVNLQWEALDRLIEESSVKFTDEGTQLKSKRNRPTIAQKVETDNVLEYWLQRYVSANPDQFGLKELQGPFQTGPDFTGKVRGYRGRVDIEVEVRCQDYIKHGHAEDRRWDNVKVLIVLDQNDPDKAIRKKLPKKILHIDKNHFEQWYREAARQYAQAKDSENAHNRNIARLEIIAGRVHQHWLEICPDQSRDMATCPECDLCPYFGQGAMFEDIALEFLRQRDTPERLNLGDIAFDEIDQFCQKVFSPPAVDDLLPPESPA
jgi:hypothetical protein